MFTFFYQLARLIRVLIKGFRNDDEFRILLVLLLFTLVGGTIFYMQFERWSLLDSLYFCVMTISTIGYGDMVPTTSISKAFTIMYALLGIGLFVSLASKIAAIYIGQKLNRKRKSKNNTDSLSDHLSDNFDSGD